MKKLDLIAFIVLLISGLNWGLMGFFEVDLLGYLGGLARIFDCLAGLSAVYIIVRWKRFKALCK